MAPPSPASDETAADSARGRLRALLLTRLEDTRARLRQIQATVQASPWRATLILLLIIAAFAASGGTLFALGDVVGGLADAISGGDESRLISGVVLLAVCLLATPLISAADMVLTTSLTRQVRIHTNDLLARVLLRPAGLRHLDGGDASRRSSELVEQARSWQVLGATGFTVGVLTQRLTALAPLVLVAVWNWWAAVLLALCASAVASVTASYLTRLLEEVSFGGSTTQQRHRYIFQVAGGAATAKEIRLFGMLPWIRPQLAGYERGGPLFTAGITGNRAVTAANLLGTLALMAVVLLAVYAAVTGTLEVGRLATVIASIAALFAGFGPLGDIQVLFVRAGRFQRSLDALDRDLEADPDPSAPERAPHDPAPDDAHAPDIEIRDLHFRYPGREEDTLAGLDLVIPAGQSVGIVGPNGAGKTTLMSLVAGLEQPSRGTVRIRDHVAHTPPEGRPDVAVILQEFTRYPLDARDNILLGREDGEFDDSYLRALIARAGGTEILGRLDRERDGIATTLAPGFSGGTDFSGGQWQRLAIARALAALDAGAGVLVLDEPTSALDVRAEAALFDDFLDLTRSVTTLLVSHRLSSVRRADRIVVIDDGRIAEDGSHEELLAAGGHYAKMFTLQAERFARAGESDA